VIRSAFAQIRGRVQGVGFRYSAQNTARSLSLKGWVRNETDGSVVTRFEGPSSEVEQFIEWLKKGPSFSSVYDVIVTEMNTDETLKTYYVTF